MTARPILFSAPMVRALLAGTKSQTRRVIKPQPYVNGYRFTGDEILCHIDELPPSAMLLSCRSGRRGYVTSDLEGWEASCPFGQPGDLLWVRETFANITLGGYPPHYFYRADSDELPPRDDRAVHNSWQPSIHMPREACRLTLHITDVRVQRVQDISREDIRAEGVSLPLSAGDTKFYEGFSELHSNFADLWDSLHGGLESWFENPWVWAITFEVLHANVDAVGNAKERAA